MEVETHLHERTNRSRHNGQRRYGGHRLQSAVRAVLQRHRSADVRVHTQALVVSQQGGGGGR